ncbi:hypothetical protein Tco_0081864 [Tanacetum coccineum]
MMKYSFNAEKEYIAIKESEYLNHSKENLDAYRELLGIINEQNKGPRVLLVGVKSLLDANSITAALIDVNAAQSKLVLLENFNENYSKCLRLLVKLQLLVHS